MFLGEYVHTLDSKARLTIPSKFRDLLAPTLVVTRNPAEPCLLVLPLTEWTALADKLSRLPMTDPASGLLRRVMFSAAEDLKADNQGRILISQRLRDYAKIEADVLVAGMNTYLELWQPTLWDERVMQQVNNGALNGALFAALGI